MKYPDSCKARRSYDKSIKFYLSIKFLKLFERLLFKFPFSANHHKFFSSWVFRHFNMCFFLYSNVF